MALPFYGLVNLGDGLTNFGYSRFRESFGDVERHTDSRPLLKSRKLSF
jgi:hypothetical protein